MDSPRPIFIETRSSRARSTLAGQADPDRQHRPARAHGADPAGDHLGVEAHLAHDVRGHRRLGEHRLDRLLVADQVVALGVAGDADRVELGCAASPSRRAAPRRRRTRRRPPRRRRRARTARAPGRLQAGEHLVEVRAVAHEARRQVRHHRVARASERSATPRVASRPLLGEAVTVTFTSVPRCAATSSSMPSSGSTSKRARRSSSARARRSRVRTAPIADISGTIVSARSGWPRRGLQPRQRRRGPLAPAGGGARLPRAARPHRDAPAGARHRPARGRADARDGDRPDAPARGGQAARAREPGVGAAAARDLRLGRGVRRHREHHRGARRAGGLRRRAGRAAHGGRGSRSPPRPCCRRSRS